MIRLAALVTLLCASASAQEAIVVPQNDAPLRITRYEADYQEGGRYSTKGIKHEVRYENATSQKIVATQIGLVSFSVFNEFMDRTAGISMDDIDPGRDRSGTWVARAPADFSFHTGVAYVAKVRFEDGTIWEADLDEVTSAIRQIEDDFDTTRLSDEDESED